MANIDDRSWSKVITSKLRVQGEQHVRQLGALAIRPASRNRSVSPSHGKRDGLDLIDILYPALEDLGRCRSIQTLDLCHFSISSIACLKATIHE